jgi:MFS family permease
MNLMGPTLPTLAAATNRTEADFGPLFTMTGVATFVASFPSGYLADVVPGHTIMAAGLALQVRRG